MTNEVSRRSSVSSIHRLPRKRYPRDQPAEWAAQLDQIRELLKPAEADPPAVKNVKSALKRYPDMWQKMLESGQVDRWSDYGRDNMDGDLSVVPGLEAKIAAFTHSVKEEIERRDNARISELEALLARAGAALPSAKKPEDLDALVLALSKTRDSDSSRNPKLSALYNELQSARQIVCNWQDYLIAVEAGKASAVRNELEQISSELSRAPILPRSVVLRLLNPQASESKGEKPDSARPSVDAILTKMSETGDSATALAALKTIPVGAQDNNSNDRNAVIAVQAVDDLRKLEPSLGEAEVFANLRALQQSSLYNIRSNQTRAIDQIALNAIARSYGIPTPSSKDTSARNFLDGMAVRARDQQDWPKLKQVINSLETLGAAGNNFGSGPLYQNRTNDLKILSLLEIGKAAEQRNDLAAAVTAYYDASVLDGQYLQRVVGYNKLAALKEKSPDQVATLQAKAEENRQRSEAARAAADMEARSRMMMMPGGGAYGRMSKEDLKPMVQEVVAEFLKEKRPETRQATESDSTPKKSAKKPAE